MNDILVRIWENLGGRVGGPMSFRLRLQPAVAALLAIRAGMQDARTGPVGCQPDQALFNRRPHPGVLKQVRTAR
jgi:hypothetical protein